MANALCSGASGRGFNPFFRWSEKWEGRCVEIATRVKDPSVILINPYPFFTMLVVVHVYIRREKYQNLNLIRSQHCDHTMPFKRPARHEDKLAQFVGSRAPVIKAKCIFLIFLGDTK